MHGAVEVGGGESTLSSSTASTGPVALEAVSLIEGAESWDSEAFILAFVEERSTTLSAAVLGGLILTGKGVERAVTTSFFAVMTS